MNRVVVFFSLIVIVTLVQVIIGENPGVTDGGYQTLSFGFILLAGYLFSDLFAIFKLPRITAYLLAGIVFGPYVCNFVTVDSIKNLRFIDDLALNFIALAAGGELRFRRLKKRTKPLGLLILSNTLVIFAGFALIMPLLDLALFQNRTALEILTMSILCGIIAIARSPSSAIAVISETDAEGQFTDTSLGVTVLTDVMIIPLFALTVSAANLLLSSSHSMELKTLVGLFSALGLSVLSGIFVGWMISLYFRFVGKERIFFILALVFATAKISQFIEHLFFAKYHVIFSLEPMIICMTAGFFVQNFYREGDNLIHAIERSSLPVYVLFFTLTGAALDLDILQSALWIALILMMLRFVLMILSSSLGGWLARDNPNYSRLYGISFITQAGVSLGLVKILSHEFETWGPTLATVLVAVIILNQIIGPVLLKFSLDWAGESKGSRKIALKGRNT